MRLHSERPVTLPSEWCDLNEHSAVAVRTAIANKFFEHGVLEFEYLTLEARRKHLVGAHRPAVLQAHFHTAEVVLSKIMEVQQEVDREKICTVDWKVLKTCSMPLQQTVSTWAED